MSSIPSQASLRREVEKLEDLEAKVNGKTPPVRDSQNAMDRVSANLGRLEKALQHKHEPRRLPLAKKLLKEKYGAKKTAQTVCLTEKGYAGETECLKDPGKVKVPQTKKGKAPAKEFKAHVETTAEAKARRKKASDDKTAKKAERKTARKKKKDDKATAKAARKAAPKKAPKPKKPRRAKKAKSPKTPKAAAVAKVKQAGGQAVKAVKDKAAKKVKQAKGPAAKKKVRKAAAKAEQAVKAETKTEVAKVKRASPKRAKKVAAKAVKEVKAEAKQEVAKVEAAAPAAKKEKKVKTSTTKKPAPAAAPKSSTLDLLKNLMKDSARETAAAIRAQKKAA